MLQKIIDQVNRMAVDLTRAVKDIGSIKQRLDALERSRPAGQQQTDAQVTHFVKPGLDPLLSTEEDAEFEEDRG